MNEHLIRHLIEWLRAEHEHYDHVPYPQVNSMLLEAHLMEIHGRLQMDPDSPVRIGTLGQVILGDQHRREVTDLHERIEKLEDLIEHLGGTSDV